MDNLNQIYNKVSCLSRTEVRHLILMMLRNWRHLGLTKSDLVRLAGKLQILIDYKSSKHDRESFVFAVSAVQDALTNPNEKRTLEQVYNSAISNYSKRWINGMGND